MKRVEVFGMGCANCTATEEMIKDRAAELGVEIEITHIYDLAKIAARGIMSTPAVVVDGTLVHKGSVPTNNDITEWLQG